MVDNPSDDTRLSPDEMRYWLEIETQNAQLAARRRISEATALVEDYTKGKLSRDEANERLEAHASRWGLGAKNPDISLRQEIDEATDLMHRRRLREKRSDERSR
jgi:hypothetical protein